MLEIKTIKNKLDPVFSLYNVQSATLFGSYAKGSATENSDVDLMVDSGLHGLQFFALVEDIHQALQKEVDVFDVTHINDGSRIQKEIYDTGVRIYG